jgi:hypothetical protein
MQLKRALIPTDVQIIRYHITEIRKSLEEFTRRLYLKNPKYEKDIEARELKIRAIFHNEKLPNTGYNAQPSHRLLEAAFEPNPAYPDRVFLLSLGLAKGIDEAYQFDEGPIITSLEIPPEQLEKLYYNFSHANWRLKVYRDERGELLFSTNEAGEDGYINMGYEVIMTEILTRIKDDIFLRGGRRRKCFLRCPPCFFLFFYNPGTS